VLTEPSEWRVQAMVEGWEALTGLPVETDIPQMAGRSGTVAEG